MSDTYQAVYDAVRSRLSNGDIGRAIQEHLQSLNLSHYADMARWAACNAATEQMRPCVLFKPKLEQILEERGEELLLWKACYGGLESKGTTPGAAMQAFDEAWNKKEHSK